MTTKLSNIAATFLVAGSVLLATSGAALAQAAPTADANASAGSDSSSTSSPTVNVNGGGRTYGTAVSYPSVGATLRCDIESNTFTLNSIFGGFSVGSSEVADIEDIQKCSLSEVIQKVLIPLAQSSDPTQAATAKRHLDALIPKAGFAEASEELLGRLAELLEAGVNYDNASSPSRRSLFTTVLTSEGEIAPSIVTLLNSGPSVAVPASVVRTSTIVIKP